MLILMVFAIVNINPLAIGFVVLLVAGVLIVRLKAAGSPDPMT